MFKKIVNLGVLLVMAFSLSACGADNKIDIGGKPVKSLLPSCWVRVMLEESIFIRENEVKIKVGIGFLNADIMEFATKNANMILTIDAENFLIMVEENDGSEDLFEKIFEEYSDNSFVCIRKGKRYIPNYYETFKLKLNSNVEDMSGTIRISAVVYFSDSDYDGKIERIYYASSDKKIAFSAKSILDAQKKLK